MDFKNLKRFLEDAGFDPEHEQSPLRAEASTRSYSRLRFPRPGAVPATAILCENLPRPYNDDDHFVAISEYLRGRGLPAPRVIAIDREQGRMLLEDFGDDDLCAALLKTRAAENGAAQRETLLQSAIDLIIRLQSLEVADLPAPVRDRRFDRAKLQAEMDYLFDALHKLAAEIGASDPVPFELSMFVSELCGWIAKSEPLVCAHRDYHSRNLMLVSGDGGAASGELKLIDFQDARLGLQYYDLASLLYDPYVPLSVQERQMGYAYFRAKSTLPDLPGPGRFYAQALQRLLKALGTYIVQVHQKGHTGYLPSIPAALQGIEEVCQLGRFPDLIFLFVRSVQRDFLPHLNARTANCCRSTQPSSWQPASASAWANSPPRDPSRCCRCRRTAAR